jgi:hypothetical protein
MFGSSYVILMRVLLRLSLHIEILVTDESLDDCFATFESIVTLLLILIMNVLNNFSMLLMTRMLHENYRFRGVCWFHYPRYQKTV